MGKGDHEIWQSIEGRISNILQNLSTGYGKKLQYLSIGYMKKLQNFSNDWGEGRGLEIQLTA